MAGQMFLRVVITERASGRIITCTDPEDAYYPFNTADGLISSEGYAEVCCISDREAVRGSGVVAECRDALLSEEQLRSISRALPGEERLREMLLIIEGAAEDVPPWLAEQIPLSADAEGLKNRPGLYVSGFILENFGQ